jgi:hypothetical protein
MPLKSMLFALILTLLGACNKNESLVTPQLAWLDKPTPLPTNIPLVYAPQKTIIRPPVDVLILWDNSPSSRFINNDTKKSLNNLINGLADRFDYHIVLAPLIPTNTNPELYLIAYNGQGLSTQILLKQDPKVVNITSDQLDAINSFAKKGSSAEAGVSQAISLLTNNQAKGIFREKSNTIVVVISNGNDNSSPSVDPVSTAQYISSQVIQLQSLRDQKLKSEIFRFMSIVPHQDGVNGSANNCPNAGYKKGFVYMGVSREIYSQVPTWARDAESDLYQDTFDLCTQDYQHVFDNINRVIQDVTINHVYQYWPISAGNDLAFDPAGLTVINSRGEELLENDPNGFRYLGYKENWNMRSKPSPGEPFSGQLIELMGTAQVTYPDYVVVYTKKPNDLIAYVVLPYEPIPGTIHIQKNGIDITSDAKNGWQYTGSFNPNQNILIATLTDRTPKTPGLMQAGFVIALYGNAIYTNNDAITLTYKRASSL